MVFVVSMESDSVSPSTRREWIEMLKFVVSSRIRTVSLHTEGVD